MPEQLDFIGGGGPKLLGGYYGNPGAGPDGETCGSCGHCMYTKPNMRRYYKCGLLKPTTGAGTDIRLKTEACQFWTADG